MFVAHADHPPAGEAVAIIVGVGVKTTSLERRHADYQEQRAREGFGSERAAFVMAFVIERDQTAALLPLTLAF